MQMRNMFRTIIVNLKVNKQWIVHFCFIPLIFFAILINFDKLYCIAVLNDEFGYWANAAFFLGYDWRPLIAETPYYSFGYSLILTGIMALMHDPELMYQMAILLNAIMLLVCYFLAYYVAVSLFPKNNKITLAITSGVVILSGSNILQSQIAWSEIVLYFLMWVLTSCIISLEKKFSYIKVIICLTIAVYMYSVHQRTIGIAAVTTLSIIAIMIIYKKKAIALIIPIIMLLGGIEFQSFVKDVQIENLWSNSITSLANNVEVDTNTIVSILEHIFFNLKDIVRSFGGKIFYLMIATFCTTFCGGWNILLSVRNSIHNRKKEPFLISQVFIMLALGAMILIGTIQTTDAETRRDVLVYSRYFENALGPFLLISICSLLNQGKRAIKFLVVSAGLIGIGGIFVFNVLSRIDGNFNIVCSPIIGAFFEMANNNLEKAMIYMTIFTVSILLVCIIVLACVKSVFIRNYIILFCFLIFGLITGYWASKYELNWRSTIEDNILSAQAVLDECPEKNIYFMKNEEIEQYSTPPKYLQFMLGDRTIEVIDRENYSENSDKYENSYIITNAADDFIPEESIYVFASNIIKIYET